MATLHVFRAKIQALVSYTDTNFDSPMKFTTNPRSQYYCYTCGRRRWAKNLSIQCYYDGCRIFCAEKVWRRSMEFPFAYERLCPL